MMGKQSSPQEKSKARARWGREAFEEFFEHIVWQCVEAGLVSGDKIFCDASLIDADASNNRRKERRLNTVFQNALACVVSFATDAHAAKTERARSSATFGR